MTLWDGENKIDDLLFNEPEASKSGGRITVIHQYADGRSGLEVRGQRPKKHNVRGILATERGVFADTPAIDRADRLEALLNSKEPVTLQLGVGRQYRVVSDAAYNVRVSQGAQGIVTFDASFVEVSRLAAPFVVTGVLARVQQAVQTAIAATNKAFERGFDIFTKPAYVVSEVLLSANNIGEAFLRVRNFTENSIQGNLAEAATSTESLISTLRLLAAPHRGISVAGLGDLVASFAIDKKDFVGVEANKQIVVLERQARLSILLGVLEVGVADDVPAGTIEAWRNLYRLIFALGYTLAAELEASGEIISASQLREAQSGFLAIVVDVRGGSAEFEEITIAHDQALLAFCQSRYGGDNAIAAANIIAERNRLRHPLVVFAGDAVDIPTQKVFA